MVLSILTKILEILVKSQMERSVLVWSNWNVWDHLQTVMNLTGWTESCCFIFTLTRCPSSLQYISFMWGIGEGNRKCKNHFCQLTQFDWKVLFHFLCLVLLVSDWLVWHNKRHPQSQILLWQTHSPIPILVAGEKFGD